MILTNKLNLPQSLFDAVKNDPYDNGGVWRSVTQLISPPKAVVLRKRHEHEIEEDVADRLYSLYGQIVHSILERANTKDLVEERLFMEVCGKRISGGADILQLSSGQLSDWKFSTVWKAVKSPKEWEEQINLLALLFEANGREVKSGEIILLMRDHSKQRAKRGGEYPAFPVQRIPITLWPKATQVAFLHARVVAHLNAESNLPDCSQEERWGSDPVFAVMKEGRKSAVRLFPSRDGAEGFLAARKGNGHSIIERPGENVRCDGYCGAAPFCEQYQKMKAISGSIDADGWQRV
jgi:hypothetical protein